MCLHRCNVAVAEFRKCQEFQAQPTQPSRPFPYQRPLQHSTLTAPGIWSIFLVDEVMVDDLWSFNSHSILILIFFFLFFLVKWCDRRKESHFEMESWLLLLVESKRGKRQIERLGHAILPTGSERSCFLFVFGVVAFNSHFSHRCVVEWECYNDG